MTTFNTGNPIGSTDARDRLDNSENADILENSTSLRYHADRLGTVRKTRYGMQKEHDDQISAHEVEHDAQIAAHEAEHDLQISAHEAEHDAQIAAHSSEFASQLAEIGWLPVTGSFETGGTLTLRNNILLQKSTKSYYQWMGSLPKAVTAGDSPYGDSNWVIRYSGMNTIKPYQPTVNPSMVLDFGKQKYQVYGESGLADVSLSSLMTFTRESTGAYYDARGILQFAAIDTPRIDYNPDTGECSGLLYEASRTNYLSYSQDLDNAAWTTSSVTVTANAATAPDGTATADAIYLSSTTYANKNIRNTGSGYLHVNTNSGGHISTYLKANGHNYAVLAYTAGTNLDVGFYVRVNLSTLEYSTVLLNWTTNSGTTPVVFIEKLSDGWCRVTAAFTSALNATGYVLRIGMIESMSASLSDAWSSAPANTVGIYAWGAMISTASYRMAYIPTTSATVTRSSDSAIIAGELFTQMFNQQEGTVVVDADFFQWQAVGNLGVFMIHGGAGSGTIQTYHGHTTGVIIPQITGYAGTQISLAASFTSTDLGFRRHAISWKWGGVARAAKGGVKSTDYDMTALTKFTATKLTLGRISSGFATTAHIKSIVYYPKQLTADELATMTMYMPE